MCCGSKNAVTRQLEIDTVLGGIGEILGFVPFELYQQLL
jgi:hypothetical protein